MNKYMLAADVPFDEEADWKEVTLEEFQQAEQNAGFINKGGGPTATAGFIGRGIMGRVLNALEADNIALRKRVEGLDQIAEDALWHDGHDNPEALEDIRKTVKSLGYTQAAILAAAEDEV